MKKILIFSLLWLANIVQAQSPQLNIKGTDSLQVRMSQLFVNVKVVGNIAYTTAEMHFVNSSTRPMEAELLFPLPEGVSVSRYAIDINGKIREAVPVNKNKGQQVFEAIEHRRVDPGLLEKVEGNNFRTRIYPIISGKERIVIIGYEQELSGFDKNNLAYQLVSSFPHKLDRFELSIDIKGAASKPTIDNDNNSLAVEKTVETSWNSSYQTAIKKENYQPSEKLTIKIPIHQEIPSVVVQSVNNQHYFYANTVVEGNKMPKKKPNSIGLIWDNSLSCRNRDAKKEIQLLDAYFKAISNTKVTLYFLNYNLEKNEIFTVVNGNWSALKTQLENVKYDGGTRYSNIKLSNYDEYLFFTDGLSTLSDNLLEKTNKPIYTITSLASSDYAFLNYNALKTGANFINLNRLNVEKALDLMLFQSLKFLGVKDNYTITELFPIAGTPVSGNFSVSGISLKSQNEIVLLFGYDEKPILEKKIVIDTKNQNANDVNIEKLWAQKKIANLEIQYNKNAEEIDILGKKYGIITQKTSLIVLEDIRDYIQYDIVPPAELRAEFDKILKENRDAALAQKKSNWENVDNYHTELKSWWNQNIKYVKSNPKKGKKHKKEAEKDQKGDKDQDIIIDHPTGSADAEVEVVRDSNRSVQPSAVPGNAVTIRGTVSDASGPLPGVNVVVKGTNRGVQTNFDGTYTINAAPGEVIDVAFMGMNSKEFVVNEAGNYNVTLQEDSKQLETVVVTAVRAHRSQPMASSTQVVRAQEITQANAPNANIVQSLAGRVSGLQINNSSNGVDSNSRIVLRGARTVSENNADGVVTDSISNWSGNSELVSNDDTKVNSWSPDRIYLKALEAAPKEKRYNLYLQLREEQINNPSFYFDVANYFYNTDEKEKGLLILSNIADLGLENHQLYKSLTYQLRQWEAHDDALFTARQLVKWREQEPQSHRDLALALEDNNQYQAAFDEFIKALEVNYFGEMNGQYEGVEDIILMDLNRMIAGHKGLKTDKLDKKYLKEMPVAIRIILNWNQMDTDIDLHIIEPTGEECFYGHKDTEAGARFSKDFTQGYGPEQYLLRNAIKGKFIIKTDYYGESALTENGPTTVMVEIYTTKANGTTERKLQTIQLGTVKENQNLAEITIN